MNTGTNVAAGILRNNGRVLICQRKKGGRYELKWEFPGGKLEPGESVEECVLRELQEELSITVTSIEKIVTESAYYTDGGTFNVAYCFISGYTGEPKNNIFEQIRWVLPDELNQMDILDGNRHFIKNLIWE